MSKLPIAMLAAIAGLSVAQPAVAQDQAPAAQSVPTLDPARLAAAKVTVDHILPAGTYRKMMLGGALSKLMDRMVDSVGAMPMAELAKAVGVPQDKLAKANKATLADVMDIMDPAYKQRQKIMMDAMMPVMTKMMATLEPSIREGLSHAYARRFTLQQLNDMNSFFATPSGTAYANNALLIQMDPEMIDRESKAVPLMLKEMMRELPAIEKKVDVAIAKLPKERSYEDLSATDKAKLANLLGLDEQDMDSQAQAQPQPQADNHVLESVPLQSSGV